MIRIYKGEYRHVDQHVLIDGERFICGSGLLARANSVSARKAKERQMEKWTQEDIKGAAAMEGL